MNLKHRRCAGCRCRVPTFHPETRKGNGFRSAFLHSRAEHWLVQCARTPQSRLQDSIKKRKVYCELLLSERAACLSHFAYQSSSLQKHRCHIQQCCCSSITGEETRKQTPAIFISSHLHPAIPETQRPLQRSRQIIAVPLPRHHQKHHPHWPRRGRKRGRRLARARAWAKCDAIGLALDVSRAGIRCKLMTYASRAGGCSYPALRVGEAVWGTPPRRHGALHSHPNLGEKTTRGVVCGCGREV